MSCLEHFIEQTYSSESVPYGNGRKKQGKVYPPFKQLRDLENTADRRKVSPAQLFVAEAKLMENYEDNKPYAKEVRQFYPTYGDLTDAELRGYFTWRTQARKYIWKTMPFTFVCLYAYELINQIGCKDPLDGYEKLANLCLNYMNVCPPNGYYYYVARWLTDYVIYYDLPPFLLRDEEDFRDGAIFILSNLDQFDDMEVGMALIIASDFRIERNRFYKQYPDDMLTVLGNVVRRLSAYYKAGRTKTWLEDYFGSFFNNPFYPFYTATFYEKSKPQDRIYEVNPARVYRVKDGHWSLRCFNFYRLKKHKPGDLIRTVDSLMRKVYGSKYPVRPVVRTKWILKFIEEEVTRQWNVTHAREEGRRKEEEARRKAEEKRCRPSGTGKKYSSSFGSSREASHQSGRQYVLSFAVARDILLLCVGAIPAHKMCRFLGPARLRLGAALLHAVHHAGGRKRIFCGPYRGNTKAFGPDGAHISERAAPLRQIRRILAAGSCEERLCLRCPQYRRNEAAYR